MADRVCTERPLWNWNPSLRDDGRDASFNRFAYLDSSLDVPDIPDDAWVFVVRHPDKHNTPYLHVFIPFDEIKTYGTFVSELEGMISAGGVIVKMMVPECCDPDIFRKNNADAFLKHLISLEDVSFAHCEWVESWLVIALAKRCPDLCIIDLSFCVQVTELAIVIIAIQLRNKLVKLDLAHCYKITGSSLHTLMLCEKLAKLDLSYCSLTTDSLLEAEEYARHKSIDLNLENCAAACDEK